MAPASSSNSPRPSRPGEGCWQRCGSRVTIDGANHTFPATADRAFIEAITLNWLSSVGRPGSAGLANGAS